MRIKAEDIKVIENYPQDKETYDEIQSTIARFILEIQIERYGQETLDIVYPIFIKAKELESTGIPFKEATEIAIKEFKQKHDEEK